MSASSSTSMRVRLSPSTCTSVARIPLDHTAWSRSASRANEALHTAAGYLLGELPRIDLSVFRPLLATLAQFDRAGRLVREHPTRGLVQELVRYAVEVSGDPSDAATGLAVLFAHSPNTSALPTATDLALASTVATSVVAGRTGWRYPHLRPAMLEAALHGAPGCRRAALMLEAW